MKLKTKDALWVVSHSKEAWYYLEARELGKLFGHTPRNINAGFLVNHNLSFHTFIVSYT